MMSKERELLYRWYKGARDTDDFSELYDKTEELLTQPEQTEPEPDIDYIVKEIHKKCFHQSLNTAPVITVRDALSIFRKHLKNKRTPKVESLFTLKELDSFEKAVQQSENLGKMYDEL